MTLWRKSSYSTGGGGTTECVELTHYPDVTRVQDTEKRDK